MVVGQLKQRKMEIRRQAVYEYYCQGKPQYWIAEQLGVNPVTITHDMQHLRELWLVNSLINFDAKKAEELAKIDNVEAVAWQAWERSCQPAEFKRTKKDSVRRYTQADAKRFAQTDDEGNSTNSKPKKRKKGEAPQASELLLDKMVEEVTSRGQCGDERFLGRIAWCIETRLKLLGLLKDQTINNNTLNINWDDMAGKPTDDQLDPMEAKIKALLPGAGQVVESTVKPNGAIGVSTKDK